MSFFLPTHGDRISHIILQYYNPQCTLQMDMQKHLNKYFAELGLKHMHDTSYA